MVSTTEDEVFVSDLEGDGVEAILGGPLDVRPISRRNVQKTHGLCTGADSDTQPKGQCDKTIHVVYSLFRWF